MAEVQRVLAEIGARDVPQVLVYNKLDRLDPTQVPRSLHDVLELDAGVRVPRVFVSALDGTGLDVLRGLVSARLAVVDCRHLEAPRCDPIWQRW